MRMSGQQWRRKWQRSQPESSAHVSQSDLPRGGAGSHDADLLRELHEQHAGALWSYALRLTGDRGQAQNVVQETILRAWRNPQILDPQIGSQRSWLYTVARNIVSDEWRTARRSPDSETDRISDQPIYNAGDPLVNRHLVAAALCRLTQEHRDVLRELCVGGSSVAQAAQALGITPGTVKSRTYYALRALRLALEELRGIE